MQGPRTLAEASTSRQTNCHIHLDTTVATYQNEREETLENASLQKGLMESRKETNVN